MPIEIKMPRLSDTMEQGTLIKWHVEQGQTIEADEILAEVETDKAMMEMPSYDDGEVAVLLVEEGETVAVGTVLAVLAGDGESSNDIATDYLNRKQSAATGNGAVAATEEVVEEPAEAEPLARGAASPLVRRLAEENHLDLASVRGTGPGGRIVKRDIMRVLDGGPSAAAITTTPAPTPAAPKPAAAPATTATAPAPASQPAAGLGQTVPLSTMRQTIARRLVESKTTNPHYQVAMNVDADPLLALQAQVNAGLEAEGVKLSVNDFLVRACAVAIHKHPLFNARWEGDSIVVEDRVNVGVAISLPEERGGGLVVATLYDADRKSLRQLSSETKALAEKARTKGLSVDELSGSTFTLSNLGMYAVDHFTAIINPPNVAILAVGAAVEKPVARDGDIVVGKEISCVLSNDHRVIDGATAAQFLQTLKHILEHPGSMLV
ncbi:MAG: dihydrolipoamide acetyltransferase family protein [Phycisphaerales bacterium JB038]